MARTRTLTQLIAEVRDRADIEGSQHITDPQITRYINQSGAALHALLVEMNQDEFLEALAGTASAPVDGATVLDLGPGVDSPGAYKLLSVEAEIDGVRRRLERWTYQEYASLTNQDGTNSTPMYRWTGHRVRILPPLAIGTACYAFFIPPYVDLEDPTDEYDGRDGWEEWVVWDAAVKCLVKEESDARQAITERDQVFARIKKQMVQRDLAKPNRAQNVRRRAWEV